jgi:hypothetical protein
VAIEPPTTTASTVPFAASRGHAGASGIRDIGPIERRPLGEIVGARAGDKGGDANLGVWARSDAAYAWLRATLSNDELKRLLPETASCEIDRFELPNLRAINFVLRGLLGAGVGGSTRFDPQAKALGEWLRSRRVDIPVILLADAAAPVGRPQREAPAP